jgi:hypothetical protein
MVIMPEWQGAGVGMRFLNAVCETWLRGDNPYHRNLRTLFHTSHPGLCSALRRDSKWRQISAVTFGSNKKRSNESITSSELRKGVSLSHGKGGYGGHFRAVQGFRYYGEAGVKAREAKR